MINSRDVRELTPETQLMYYKFKQEMDKAGIKFIVTSTFRDKESQDYIYSQGRTIPGMRVTGASGGFSFHQQRVAFDICMLDSNGRENWNDNDYYKPIEIAEKCGLRSGKRYGDLPHLQSHQTDQIRDLIAIYGYERKKDWKDEDNIDPNTLKPYKDHDLVEKKPLVQSVVVGEDKPVEIKKPIVENNLPKVETPVVTPESTSILGFAKYLFDKFKKWNLWQNFQISNNNTHQKIVLINLYLILCMKL